jgi:hypothetical protein
MNEMEIAISQEITELVEQILNVDADSGEVLPKHTLDEIDRVARGIGEIATAHLCE